MHVPFVHIVSSTFLDEVLKIINSMLLNLNIKFLTGAFLNQQTILNFPGHKFSVAGELTVYFDLHLKEETQPDIYQCHDTLIIMSNLYCWCVSTFYLFSDFSTSIFT